MMAPSLLPEVLYAVFSLLYEMLQLLHIYDTDSLISAIYKNSKHFPRRLLLLIRNVMHALCC
jgi:hypothetical protein